MNADVEDRNVMSNEERILRLEIRLFNLTQWLESRGGQCSYDINGDDTADSLDFALMAKALSKAE